MLCYFSTIVCCLYLEHSLDGFEIRFNIIKVNSFWLNFQAKMSRSEFVKGMAVGMLRCGKSCRFVGRQLGVSHSTVSKWWSQWNSEGNVKRRKGSGRPRLTNHATDRKLVISAKRNRFKPVTRLAVSWKAASGIACSIRATYRRLAEIGLRSYRPAVRIPLSKLYKNFTQWHCFTVSFFP